MRHVSRTHRVALDWLFDRINLDPKIQIKYINTKNQLADILPKGNFARDEWNHLLNLFDISHFSSTACSAAMAKRAGMTLYGYQDPGKSVASDDGSGKPETGSWDILQKVDPHREEPLLGGNAHSARYGETIHDGSGKPETVNHQGEANSENFVMGSDASRICEQSQRPSAKQKEKDVERCRVR